MTGQYYYQLFGQEFGPVSLDDIIKMLSQGELHGDDSIREGESGTWELVDSVPVIKDRLVKVTLESAELATDIDSFMLVDEKKVVVQGSRSAGSRAVPMAPVSKPPEFEVPVPPASTDESWYFQTFGQELGPVSRQELMRMAKEGELGRNDLIRQGANGRWNPAHRELSDFATTVPQSSSTAPSKATPVVSGPVSYPAYAPLAPTFQATNPPMVQPQASDMPGAPAYSEQDSWYCYVDEQELGPLGQAEVQQLINSGHIHPDGYIKFGAMGEWYLISQIPQFSVSQYSVPQPVVPAVAVPAPAPVAAPMQVYATPPAGSAASVNVTQAVTLAEQERTELVHQLLALLKQEGLPAQVLAGTPPAGNDGWFCNISGSVVGPVTIESLVQMVLQKRIFPEDQIRLGTQGEWFAAKTVPDLFPELAPKSGKKTELDDAFNVLARIDLMYKEAEVAKAKMEAEKQPANGATKTVQKSEVSRSKLAGDVLRQMNTNIARTTVMPQAATRSSGGSGDSLGEQLNELFKNLKFDGKTIGIIAAVVVIGVGGFFGPKLLSGFAVGSTFDALVEIQKEIASARNQGVDDATWSKKSKEIIKKIDTLIVKVKGGSQGTAQRDVARMGTYLKEMAEMAAKKGEQKAGETDDYTRASKYFDDYAKSAKKKLGKS